MEVSRRKKVYCIGRGSLVFLAKKCKRVIYENPIYLVYSPPVKIPLMCEKKMLLGKRLVGVFLAVSPRGSQKINPRRNAARLVGCQGHFQNNSFIVVLAKELVGVGEATFKTTPAGGKNNFCRRSRTKKTETLIIFFFFHCTILCSSKVWANCQLSVEEKVFSRISSVLVNCLLEDRGWLGSGPLLIKQFR